MAENNLAMKLSEMNLQTAELIDIELPMPPQTDWGALWPMFGWSLVVLLIVLLVWLLMRHSRAQQQLLLLKPFWLRWQINRQLKSLNSKTASALASETELFSYYQLTKQLFDFCQKQAGFEPLEQVMENANQLVKQAELMTFSSQKTDIQQLIACYQQSLAVLEKSIRWSAIFSTVANDLVGRVKARFGR